MVYVTHEFSETTYFIDPILKVKVGIVRIDIKSEECTDVTDLVVKRVKLTDGFPRWLVLIETK